MIPANRIAADLVALWWALVCAAPLVPHGHLLARADLAPWAVLTLTLGALARGGPLGEGPHPMLRLRRAPFAGLLRRIAAAAVPGALFGVYELAHAPSAESARWAAAAIAVVFAGRWLGREDGESAWEPEDLGATVLAAGAVCAVLALAVLAGATGTPALLIGASFLGIGLAAGRPQHLAQRRAAGRRDGRPTAPSLFRPLLALVGPSLAFGLLEGLYTRSFGPLGFEQAFAVSLLVLAWVGLLWPPPPPAAVQCALHEVIPVGGADARGEETAADFDQPPEGALRLSPLRVRRTNAVHFWIVPAADARIGAFDDPVRPLWSQPPLPLPSHVLGTARFEVERGRPQTRTLTLTLRGQTDTSTVGSGDAATRRVVVLRASPSRPWGALRARTTYRWQAAVPAESIQGVDATTRSLTLRDGDVLVVSTEGVARAYQLEIGAPLSAHADVLGRRPPQLEDYARP